MLARLRREVLRPLHRVLGHRGGTVCCWACAVTLLLMAALLAVGTSDIRAAERPSKPSPAKAAPPVRAAEPSKVVTADSVTTETVAPETVTAEADDSEEMEAADEDGEETAAGPGLVTSVISVFQAVFSAGDSEPALPKMGSGTHPKISHIAVAREPAGCSLQTMCLNLEGHVLALVGPPRFTPPNSKSKALQQSEVREYEVDGTLVRSWKVSYVATAINVGPDGTIYVAGSGQLSRFDPTGKELATQELPHVVAAAQDREGLRKSAEAQRDQYAKMYEAQITQARRRLEQLESRQREEEAATTADKDAPATDSTTKRRRPKVSLTQQIAAQKAQLKALEKSMEGVASIEKLIDATLVSLRSVNALAVSERDIFVVTREVKGYGFCIVRNNLNLSEHETIVTGLSGCCGQMDVQCRDGQVWAAENSRHRVCGFDRDGKRLTSFGKAAREGKDGHFGSCCNPMNLRFGSDGDIYTAESEGLVKRFSADGEYKDLVGRVQLTGGCKNVAVEVSRDGRQVFFCDQPGSRIIVLTQPDKTVTQAD